MNASYEKPQIEITKFEVKNKIMEEVPIYTGIGGDGDIVTIHESQPETLPIDDDL